jgi:hypothetical protein
MSSGLDEQALTRSMVLVLRKHPGEWFTFRRLSRLVAVPGMDENAIGGMAEYRNDLFAISNDRKVKLCQSALEEIARQDVADWVVPRRPDRDERRELRGRVARAIQGAEGSCYCNVPPPTILREILGEKVPDEALILSCCWITICRVRGPDMHLVSSDVWSELCRRRVYIQRRENPRDL